MTSQAEEERCQEENLRLLQSHRPHKKATVADIGTGLTDYVNKAARGFPDCRFVCVDEVFGTASYMLKMTFGRDEPALGEEEALVEVRTKDDAKLRRLVAAQNPKFIRLLVGNSKVLWNLGPDGRLETDSILDRFKRAKRVSLTFSHIDAKRRELKKDAPKNVRFVGWDIPKIPLEDNSVDLLTEFRMCLNLEAGMLKPFYNEVCRVLKAGGTFITTLPKTMRVGNRTCPTQEFLERLGYAIIDARKYPYTNKLDSYVCIRTERVKPIDFEIPKIPHGKEMSLF